MTLQVRCPNGHVLNLKDEYEGKRVKCPKCRESFVAGGDEEEDDDPKPVKKKAKPAAKKKSRDEDDDAPPKKKPKAKVRREDDDDDDDFSNSNLTPQERRKARTRDRRERLKKVRTGLLVYQVKLWLIVIVILFGFLTVIFDTALDCEKRGLGEERLSQDTVETFGMFSEICRIILIIGLIVTPIVGVAASVICAMVPKKSESRGSIITSLVFDVIPLISAILMPLAYYGMLGIADPVKNRRLLGLLQSGSAFFSIAALFLFILFLRQLCYYVKESVLAGDVLNILSWLIIVTVSGPVVMGGIGFLAPIVIGAMDQILNLGVMFILTLIWFAVFYYIFFQGLMRIIVTVRDSIAESTGLKKDDDEEEDEEEE